MVSRVHARHVLYGAGLAIAIGASAAYLMADGGVTEDADPRAATPRPTAMTTASARVRRLTDSRVPLAQRKREIRALATAGDAASVADLMTLARKRTYVNRFAAEALGLVRAEAERDRIRTFLTSRLAAADPLMAAACIRAYARHAPDDIAETFPAMLRRNAVRSDGHAQIVCTAIVRALGRSGSGEAVDALARELDRAGQGGWSLAYGLEVAEALRVIGDKRGRPPLLAFARRLEAERPRDLAAGRAYDAAVRDVRRAAAQLS